MRLPLTGLYHYTANQEKPCDALKHFQVHDCYSWHHVSKDKSTSCITTHGRAWDIDWSSKVEIFVPNSGGANRFFTGTVYSMLLQHTKYVSIKKQSCARLSGVLISSSAAALPSYVLLVHRPWGWDTPRRTASSPWQLRVDVIEPTQERRCFFWTPRRPSGSADAEAWRVSHALACCCLWGWPLRVRTTWGTTFARPT